jgi:hypothetical protein
MNKSHYYFLLLLLNSIISFLLLKVFHSQFSSTKNMLHTTLSMGCFLLLSGIEENLLFALLTIQVSYLILLEIKKRFPGGFELLDNFFFFLGLSSFFFNFNKNLNYLALFAVAAFSAILPRIRIVPLFHHFGLFLRNSSVSVGLWDYKKQLLMFVSLTLLSLEVNLLLFPFYVFTSWSVYDFSRRNVIKMECFSILFLLVNQGTVKTVYLTFYLWKLHLFPLVKPNEIMKDYLFNLALLFIAKQYYHLVG